MKLTLSFMNDCKLALVNYLVEKVKCEDWHAVADAAMDLREIEAKISIIRLYDKFESTK